MADSSFIVRRFEPADAADVAQLFYNTVRRVNRADYSQEQVEAWAPDIYDLAAWLETCSRRITFVAPDPQIVGFAELVPAEPDAREGHVDRFYTLPMN